MMLRIRKASALFLSVSFLSFISSAGAQEIAPLPPAVEIAPLQEAVPVRRQEEINPAPAPDTIPMVDTDGVLVAPPDGSNVTIIPPMQATDAPVVEGGPTVTVEDGSTAAEPESTKPSFEDYPVIKLQSLDKTTARTLVFEARVGSTVKFGPLYIKIPACRKTPPIEKPEAAAFLQVWEVNAQKQAKWVFSGWMFASSPALSAMNHPVYDVWVIDCLEHKTGEGDSQVEVAPQDKVPPAKEQAEPLPAEEPLD